MLMLLETQNRSSTGKIKTKSAKRALFNYFFTTTFFKLEESCRGHF